MLWLNIHHDGWLTWLWLLWSTILDKIVNKKNIYMFWLTYFLLMFLISWSPDLVVVVPSDVLRWLYFLFITMVDGPSCGWCGQQSLIKWFKKNFMVDYSWWMADLVVVVPTEPETILLFYLLVNKFIYQKKKCCRRLLMMVD